MATIKPTWVENQALHASSSVAAGVSVEDDIDISALGYDLVIVTVEIIFGASPDDVTQVDVLYSTDSGVNKDTEAAICFVISQENSATKRRSFAVSAAAFATIKITNTNSSEAITYESWYAGRNWSSV